MEKDSPPKQLRSPTSIRHAYETTLSACARLLAYASAEVVDDLSPISQRLDVLAQEDLTAFATHGRRLVDCTISLELASRVTVEGLYDDEQSNIPITRIFNVIIHHKEIEIHRTDRAFQRSMCIAKAGHYDPVLLYDIEPNSIPPVCLVTSDRGNKAFFRIKDLVERFSEEILGQIIEYCEERNLYLDEFFRD